MAKKFDDVSSYAEEVIGGYSQRDTMYRALENMFLLEGAELPTGSDVKQTISPDARNALLGAVRLLTAADPKFRVPFEMNNDTAKQASSSMEVAAQVAWYECGRIRQKALTPEIALQALLYSEIHIAVNLTADILATAKGPLQKRAQMIASRTPLMFEPLSPAICYPVNGPYGLSSHVTSQDLNVVDVKSRWGDKFKTDKSDFDTVTYREYWDYERHTAWVSGDKTPIIDEVNKLGFIPIGTQIVEGSDMYTQQAQQRRQPFLYTLWKSGLWNRQNLSLTVLYTLIFGIGANPMFIWKRNDPTKASPQRNHDLAGGLLIIDQGEEYQSLLKQTIDPSITQGLTIADDKATASTIYRQTLGEPLGANAPYSMVAMLNQAGRLPLVPYQRAMSVGIAEAMQDGFSMLRATGGGKAFDFMSTTGKTASLTSKDIPEKFVFTADVDIKLPQDQRENVMIAVQGTSGPEPLFSKRWAREQYLEIEQSDQMEVEIWQEKMATKKLQLMALQMDLQIQAAQTQIQQQSQVQAQQANAAQMGQQLAPQGNPQGQQGLTPNGVPTEAGQQGVGSLQGQQQQIQRLQQAMSGGQVGLGNAATPGEGQAQSPGGG